MLSSLYPLNGHVKWGNIMKENFSSTNFSCGMANLFRIQTHFSFSKGLYEAFGLPVSKSQMIFRPLTARVPDFLTAISADSSRLKSMYPKPFSCLVCPQTARRTFWIGPQTLMDSMTSLSVASYGIFLMKTVRHPGGFTTFDLSVCCNTRGGKGVETFTYRF